MFLFKQKSFLLCVLMLFSVLEVFSQVTISGTNTTISDCPNNGSITVDVTQTTTGSLLYSITDGPQIQGQQSSNSFTSLSPGVYTIFVEDFFGNTDTEIVEVFGSYRDLSFIPEIEQQISCIGTSDAVIVGNVSTFTGKSPYSWEITSPISLGPQVSDRFESLGPAVYTIKVTDACGEADTRNVEVEEDLQGLNLAYSPRLSFTSCTEAEMTISIDAGSYVPPYVVTTTINGTPTSVTITDEEYEDVFESVDLDISVPGISYGDNLQMSIEDGCNRNVIVFDNVETVQNFSFCSNSSPSNSNCGLQMDLSIQSLFGDCFDPNEISTNFHSPIDYELTNVTSNITETGIIESYSGSGYDIEDIAEQSDFELSLTDQCGNSQVITFSTGALPSVGVPTVTVEDAEPSECLDGAANIEIKASGFSSQPFLILKSGPAVISSDKKDFEYDYNLVYPDTIDRSGASGSGSASITNIDINSLPVGVYAFDVLDTCGNVVSSTFEVKETDLSSLDYELNVTRDCLGNNTINVNSDLGSGTYRIFSFSAGIDERYRFYFDLTKEHTFTNLPPSDYFFSFSNGTQYRSPIDDLSGTGFHDCFFVDSIIAIEPYSDPFIRAYNTVICDNSVFVELLVDTTTGIGPYEYEIFDGPATFPLQSSNVFELTTVGIYRARIHDDCGNVRVREITIENLEFEPLNSAINCSNAEIIYPSSLYFSYEWTRPNGTRFTGDTLSIPLIEAEDTGLYTVVQNVTIGSCTDDFTQTYQVDMMKTSEFDEIICPGTSITYGGEVIEVAGDYVDTLTTVDGCDSLSIMHLSLYDYNYGFTSRTICHGGSVLIAGKSYATAGVFYDTLSTIDCDSVLEITIDYSPYLRGTYTGQICEGSSVLIEGLSYTTAGVFYDTISNGACDSIIEITLIGTSFLRDTIDAYFCTGSSVTVNGQAYNIAGEYIDTISSASFCDSIIVKNIEEKLLPVFNLGKDTSICENASITFNGPDGYPSYRWINGVGQVSTDINYLTSIVELVTLQVTDDFGCVGEDQVEVLAINPLPLLTLNNPPNICINETVELIVTGADRYDWSPNISETSGTVEVSPSRTTVYTVIGYSSFDCASDQMNVTVIVNPVPSTPLITDDVIAHCFIESSSLTVVPNWGESFIWTPSEETSDELLVYTPGAYFVEALDEYNCTYKDDFSVINKCITVIAVPEAFSPNFDNLHDELEIKGKNFTDFEMRIFNRWGELIFRTSDLTNMWDGTYRGELMPVGSYPWVINYRSIDESLEPASLQTRHGSVSIIK